MKDKLSKVSRFSEEQCLLKKAQSQILYDAFKQITWVEQDNSTLQTFLDMDSRKGGITQVSGILDSLKKASENYDCSYQAVDTGVWLLSCNKDRRYF